MKKNNKASLLTSEVVSSSNITFDIKYITRKIETEFRKITEYLKSKYRTDIGQSIYKSYYMNVRCGVVCDVNSGSSIVQDIFSLTEEYLKISQGYIDYLNNRCFEIDEELRTIINDIVNSKVFPTIKNTLDSTLKNNGINSDEICLRKFDISDFCLNDIFYIKFISVPEIDVDLEVDDYDNSINICWTEDSLNEYWDNMNNALNRYIYFARKQLFKKYVENFETTLKIFIEKNIEDNLRI